MPVKMISTARHVFDGKSLGEGDEFETEERYARVLRQLGYAKDRGEDDDNAKAGAPDDGAAPATGGDDAGGTDSEGGTTDRAEEADDGADGKKGAAKGGKYKTRAMTTGR